MLQQSCRLVQGYCNKHLFYFIAHETTTLCRRRTLAIGVATLRMKNNRDTLIEILNKRFLRSCDSYYTFLIHEIKYVKTSGSYLLNKPSLYNLAESKEKVAIYAMYDMYSSKFVAERCKRIATSRYYHNKNVA